MGIADLRSVKEFILQKSLQDHQLTRDEEKFLDSLNKQVSYLLAFYLIKKAITFRKLWTKSLKALPSNATTSR